MAWRQISLFLVALLLLWPVPARAQPVAPTPPPDAPTSWDTLPDLLDYVTFRIPYLYPECEPAPTSSGWTDTTYPFRWLAWKIKQLVGQLICILLALAQFFANLFAAVINAVITGLNAFWRLLIFVWLTLRAWWYGLWWLVELWRDAWHVISYWLLWLWQWIQEIWFVLLAMLDLVGQLALMLVQIVLAVLGIVSWLGGLILGLATAVLDALDGSSIPSQLSDTHMIYRMLRGALEGFRDSQIGWVLYLLWGLCYIGFITWLARFLAEKGKATA